MLLHDSVSVSGVRRTADGYLVADARVARTGIQEYLGSEVGKPEMPIVRVYRPPESVFAEDAMRSYAYRPMTNGHHGEVTAENWKKLAIGQTGSEVLRDGDFVRVPLVLMDADAIRDYEAGKRELSMGLEAEVIFEDGVTPTGETYDARLGPMRMNHLALVDHARGGEQLRIGDSRAPGAKKPAQPTPTGGHDMADALRKLLVDGLTIETTEQGAQVVEKLQKQLGDAGANLKTIQDAHATAMAAKDAELAKKDAEIDGLKGKVLNDAAIDKLVRERADLIASAMLIADGDYAGKSAAEIRKAAVVAKLGDAAIKDKPEAYIAARFDILLEDAASNDPVRVHLKQQDSKPSNPADNGQSAYEARVNGAWKGGDK
ncbi:DUF2213 domain-containing protein [Pseudomonas aeruginosa]|uniref:DUF2213 domain-containing protein n=1 Tax=Pseudomonas aeruginosa TaxID=287 RepID=UPI00066CB23C|nr:DUF2213 domain-containing protein [Pseudomonas aeruginosa]EJY6033090.1 DUF2213 domain-containing protein [Pseudomonas aeruginosa]EKC7897243.1 DUF2213 domain-containing protein [Pseudomonas aeruginosa]EKM9120281.1 DUF2213 domain-containing protein [Pseudomonas aeruginosa]EKT8500471.1 DUF2213 domain-containing protein [Pseudomonas aeruginosa]EKV0245648.1 DUF2213 domain-containing protein [Pseudomonas aeruginosa]